MYQLKKLDIGSVALYSFIMFLILGLIVFLPMGLIFTFISTMVPQSGDIQPEIFPFFGGIFFILIPVFYAVFGTLMNVLIALCYNLLSIKLGGIKFKLEKLAELDPVPPPQ